jgi:cysteinyl-tRNA synthetase
MAELFLYDSAARAKRRFEPLDPQHVKLYVCGPTVYDLAHLGNARPVVVFDVLVRLLRRLYPCVTYVRNITDVDDKINTRARESGEPIAAITARTTADFHADMAALGALPPNVEPRATDHIAEMITLIEALIKNGHAYAADGHVLFSVPSFANYGKLSGRSPDELLAGARVDVAPYKRDAGDFVLWKPSDAETPGWESPWGRGRPGWHIECSAMSWKHLGESFDIHGGGHDLIFPHHENELAQSVCAFPDAVFARYWMHNGMLLVNGEKMSKSLGNFLTVRDILKKGAWAGEAFRLLVLKTHYRQDLNFSFEELAEAKKTLDGWYSTLLRLDSLKRYSAASLSHKSFPPKFLSIILDDLNTPGAFSMIHDLMHRANSLILDINAANFEKNTRELSTIKRQLTLIADVFGILQQRPQQWLQGSLSLANFARRYFELATRKPNPSYFKVTSGLPPWKATTPKTSPSVSGNSADDQHVLSKTHLHEDREKYKKLFQIAFVQHAVPVKVFLTNERIKKLIARREEAREAKNWAEADSIRDDLKAQGIILEDGAGGTTWKRA